MLILIRQKQKDLQQPIVPTNKSNYFSSDTILWLASATHSIQGSAKKIGVSFQGSTCCTPLMIFSLSDMRLPLIFLIIGIAAGCFAYRFRRLDKPQTNFQHVSDKQNSITVGNLSLDYTSQCFFYGENEKLKLTPQQFSLMKLGASDYIAKPINPDKLLVKIREVVKNDQESQGETSSASQYIEGQSPAARQLFEHVRLVAPTDMSVLISGSSGTGKEYVARRIHEQSGRRHAPFVAVDCGAIPKELAASEFFGHIKGSFTGAIENKEGAFAVAQGGTIFLDEIGNLSYEVQVQLLRALQERKIKRIGSNQEIAINVRLISATNENLRTAIDRGEFREDLYHRINEFSIRIPDLKDRREDLLLFANSFLDQANSELSKDIIGFDNKTIDIFQTYSWPGNLRQMKNAIKYATLLATGRYITPQELPEELKEITESQDVSLHNESHDRDLILKALQEAGNNKTRAAQLLGVDRKTLYNKLKALHIEE